MAWVGELDWKDGKGRSALEVGTFLDVYNQDMDAELRGTRVVGVEGHSRVGQPTACARESSGEFHCNSGEVMLLTESTERRDAGCPRRYASMAA